MIFGWIAAIAIDGPRKEKAGQTASSVASVSKNLLRLRDHPQIWLQRFPAIRILLFRLFV